MLIARMMEVGGTVLALIGLLIQLGTGGISTVAEGWALLPLPQTGALNAPCYDCKVAPRVATHNAVRIEFEGRGSGFRYSGVSQGTIVDGNRLLTHHHYSLALETLESLTLTLSDAKGNHTHVAVEPRQIIAIDAGTTLIPLPETALWNTSYPTVRENAVGIQHGASVTVLYLNANGDPTPIELPVFLYDTVTHPGLTSLILKDPQGQIEPGDSGGGVYYQGTLIGNLWAIGPAEDGGTYVRVALIPLG